MATADKLLTAEEYGQLPDLGYPSELVLGRILQTTRSRPRHGQVCAKAAWIVGNYADKFDCGHVLSNDSAVITHRNPDSVRGADVSFYSFHRVPKGPIEQGYLEVVPEVVIEVLSPDDRWPKTLAKIAEYLDAGVGVVCVLDPATRTARLYRANGDIEMLDGDQPLRLPELSESFAEPVSRFFE